MSVKILWNSSTKCLQEICIFKNLKLNAVCLRTLNFKRQKSQTLEKRILQKVEAKIQPRATSFTLEQNKKIQIFLDKSTSASLRSLNIISQKTSIKMQVRDFKLWSYYSKNCINLLFLNFYKREVNFLARVSNEFPSQYTKRLLK